MVLRELLTDARLVAIAAALISAAGALVGILITVAFNSYQARRKRVHAAKTQFDEVKKDLYVRFLLGLFDIYPHLKEGAPLDETGKAERTQLESLFLGLYLIADTSVIERAAVSMAMIRSHLPHHCHFWSAMGVQIGSKPASSSDIRSSRVKLINSMREELGQKAADVRNPYMGGGNVLDVLDGLEPAMGHPTDDTRLPLTA